MSQNTPKLQELLVSEPVSLQQLQASMKQDRYEMLQYLVLEEAVLLWHIQDDAIHVRSVFLPRPELIKKVEQLKKSLGRDKTFDAQTAKELFLFLIQPALQWIKTDHLVIVPHEDLYYIPFQILQDPSDNSFLGERFQISYAPSATILSSLQKGKSIAGESLLALADPKITEAKTEVKTIARLYPDRHKIVTESLVKETDVKTWVGDYTLLHLSVHGKFTPDTPLLSYLKLKKDNQNDGNLTAAEMFGLPLENTRLAVFSACETGQSEVTHANEVTGMIRALLYAGANTLILSHWAVDAASTALWMETFYREAQTKPLSEAARLALMTVKKNSQYQHSFYWGAFFMVGR